MIDIKHTDDGDIDFSSGDIQYAESTKQHQSDILTAFKGTYKEFPTVGVGTINYIASNNKEGFLRNVRKQFAADGMKVKSIGMTDTINVDATYEADKS